MGQVKQANAMEGIPRLLYDYRHDYGLTQAELAGRVGASVQSVQNWESGECLPSFGMAVRLADMLGVSLDAFRT